ncbi:MAG: ParB protein, partial [uncultured bacterium]
MPVYFKYNPGVHSPPPCHLGEPKTVVHSSYMENIKVEYVDIRSLKKPPYNPRKSVEADEVQLMESIKKFGTVDPLIVNNAPERMGIVIGGNFRLSVLKKLGYKEVPVVFVNIPDIKQEQELNLRLNRNTGSWDWKILSEYFNEDFLAGVGFTSEEFDKYFPSDDIPETFDLAKELKKLDITNISVQKGDVYALGEHKLCCGDSTVEEDVLKLMGSEKADMCMTDEPYLLSYLGGKRHGKPTEGFGAKKNRRYLETDVLPNNFISLWMANVAKVAKPDFSIISFENWKNTRAMWDEIEKYWKVRNMIIWRLKNRHQGFSAKYKFFSKYDIAMVGTSEGKGLNSEPEEELLQNEFETALYATSGKPHWEGYERGKKDQPTDFI